MDLFIQLRGYSNEVDGLRKRINRIQENYTDKRAEEALVITSEVNHQNKKLIENEEMAWSQHHKLDGARRSVMEMDSIGLEVIKDLKNQTDQLKNIQDKNDSLMGTIDDSNNIMTRMFKREHRNKIIIIASLVLFVMIFLIVLFTKLI
jgi:hypothetical protein